MELDTEQIRAELERALYDRVAVRIGGNVEVIFRIDARGMFCVVKSRDGEPLALRMSPLRPRQDLTVIAERLGRLIADPTASFAQ